MPEIYCSDFTESLAYYSDVVGFRIRYERVDERFAFLDLDGAELMIEQTVESTRMLVSGDLVPPYGRGLNLQISVDDVDLVHTRIISAGCPIFLPMEERWYQANDVATGQRQFVAPDPDGYLLRFCQELGERSCT